MVDRDIPDETGMTIRNPAMFRQWMMAYAAAVSTTTSFEKIRDAATPGQVHKPAQPTAQTYRDALTRVWILDEIPAWIPANNPLNQLGQSPKHQFADPALAARLLGVNAATLLKGQDIGPEIPRNGTLLGAMFESLVGLSLKVYASNCEATVRHMRTDRGRQEIDLIIERDDGGIVAIEVKLKQTVGSNDVRHLLWLKEKLGNRLLDSVVVTTGSHAYRRPDQVAVVPLALLGP